MANLQNNSKDIIDNKIIYNLEMANINIANDGWTVIKRDGSKESVQFDKIANRIRKMSNNLKINVMEIAQRVISSIYDGVSTTQIDQETAEIAITKLTEHPDYGILATRLCISNNHKNTSPSFSEVTQALYDNVDINNNPYPLINKKYYDFVMTNAKKINAVIDYQKDYNYDYFGFKTLERAYLWKVNGVVVERPQHMIMRVCLSIHKDDLKEAIKSYRIMSDGFFTHATPTLFNMGSNREQSASCFLINISEDSIQGIYKTLSDCAAISKYAGGIGISIHKIRAKNSKIRGTNGITDGIIPMLKVFNETACYVNQAGKRKGSIAVYLEPWHADIIEFLMLRRNTGAEAMRARDLFYAMWIPDLFMKRVEADEDWTLMCPDKCPGLHEVYGDKFEELYHKYESEGKGYKTVKARYIWETIIDSQIETGTPYIGFKDSVNKKNNQMNLGTIQSSNLCHEIVEYTSPDEIAVCNLASIALPKFVEIKTDEQGNSTKKFNFDLLREVTKQVTRNLNKIIDYNFYPVPEAERSNRRHRPIGIGVQGLADTFFLMKYPFDSSEAKELNRLISENIYLASLEASMELARKRKKYVQEYKRLVNNKVKNSEYVYTDEEQTAMKDLKETHFIIDEELKLPGQYAGSYSSFIGSPIHDGKLQFDLWGVEPSEVLKDKWNELKSDIRKHGVRNSLTTAYMPTASTSQILGNFESFEPPTNNIFTRNTLAGTFMIINKHLVRDLLELGMWNKDLKDQIIINNGSIQDIEGIPENIKNLYKTVWEIKQRVLIDLSAERSPFVDQTQSFNVYMPKPTYKSINAMHFYSWKKGLKTGIYYFRTKASAQAQKFSVDISKVQNTDKLNDSSSNNQNNQNNQNMNETGNSTPNQPFVCRRDDPDCLMCSA